MKKQQHDNLFIAPALFEIGFRISIPLVLMVIFGSYVDNKLGTKPLFILLGIFFSLFTSFYGIYKSYHKYSIKRK